MSINETCKEHGDKVIAIDPEGNKLCLLCDYMDQVAMLGPGYPDLDCNEPS